MKAIVCVLNDTETTWGDIVICYIQSTSTQFTFPLPGAKQGNQCKQLKMGCGDPGGPWGVLPGQGAGGAKH